jgi:hypothetical protein
VPLRRRCAFSAEERQSACFETSGSGSYRLVGGRLLASHNGPETLFMHEDSQGRRVTLCVCRDTDDDGRMTHFRYAEHERFLLFCR